MRRLYIIYDRVAETFVGPIIVDRADAPVVRSFHDVLADPKTSLGQHPGDYDVRCIAQITDVGQVLPLEHTTIATGSAWQISQERAASTQE